jgi:hypothetical protein
MPRSCWGRRVGATRALQRRPTQLDDTTSAQDSRALDLRMAGRSFGHIARELGLERPSDASRAFNRALRRRSRNDQARIRAAELERLEGMAAHTRAREGATDDEVAGRLRAVELLRTELLAD